MSSQLKPGLLLRDLRKQRGLTLEQVANEIDITPLALSNIERKGAKPQRGNLIALLDELNKIDPLTLQERRSMLAHYGYTDTAVPPNPNRKDQERAKAIWAKSFQKMATPAYLVDVEQVVLDFNDLALTLMNRTTEQVKGVTLYDLLFSEDAAGELEIVNREEVIFKTVVHIWSDYLPFQNEQWCKDSIARAKQRYPMFSQIYDTVAESNFMLKDVSVMEPVILKDAKDRVFRFRLVGLDIVGDPRFRVVQYIPMDGETMQLLADTIEKR